MTQTETHLEQLKSYLSKQGLKSTKQRDIIVEIFLQTTDHIDIEALYTKVKKKHPEIGYATVYRTMKLLKECGIAAERHFGTRHAVYEPHVPHMHHDHLICEKCNAIIEFENLEIEALQEQVAKKHKFQLTTHKHELYGFCSQCKS